MRYPEPQGLYHPDFEHDSCGVGFVADLHNRRSHKIIQMALRMLSNLKHRGALGADPETGDGAGLLMQIPHRFYQEECEKLGFTLPEPGEYGVASLFLPQKKSARRHCGVLTESMFAESGLAVLGWRDVPCDLRFVGKQAAESRPEIRQLFIGKGELTLDQTQFERQLYITRKRIRNSLAEEDLFMVVSLSTRIVVYKGMLTAEQMDRFFPDLADPRVESALALMHTRFPTNTFPRWDLAQPFRYLAHNGEINTLRGNINWMRSRQGALASPLYEDIPALLPIVLPRGSDSACFDNVLEFLVQSGYSMAHAMMMMVPEAWQNHPEMTPEKQAFYEYHEHLIEPWDGPAALCFTDGKQIGAILDRNGLRPARYVRTKNDLIVVASEVGAVGLHPEEFVEKGRLQPGKMFLIDLEEGRIIDDTELKQQICSAKPYQQWLGDYMLRLSDLPEPTHVPEPEFATLLSRQKVFGYTTEDVNVLLTPMATESSEATGSMGNDTPLAVLSDRPRLLYDYFKQIFAQVSNPAIDSIREELVMSLTDHLGRKRNILDPGPEHAHMLKVEHPVLTNAQMAQLRELDHRGYYTKTLSLLFPAKAGPEGMASALQQLCTAAETTVREGCPLLVLSDRGVDAENVPIPALLATGAVHHHLIRKRIRYKMGLIVETGEAREIAHFCLLAGYGAGGINPYLAFESFAQLLRDGMLPNSLTFPQVEQNYLKAIRKGMFKVFAKMGISTLLSYSGAQIFEAVGLNEDVVREYFAGTPSRISGAGLETIAKEALIRHYEAYLDTPDIARTLDVGGHYYWRRRGEFHQINPISTELLQKATQGNNPETFQRFSQLANDQSRKLATLRGVLAFTTAVQPVPLAEVEAVSEIVKRFATGAMSLGSISKEAHETLAVAMNRLGARSNSGEGGEDSARYAVRENGDWPISKIKQVASGRFGVTIHYLVNSTELQIKVAQGAKPGEGGQLPGRKVSEYIAKVRHSTPGVTLISPPPHHDIYSIEDLAQLIFDLKNANPDAKINVKLVAEAGVGTIAAGVAKAHADIITIAGHDGGTGASPLTSIKHAGVPWELGISEVQQVLLLNKLRGRVRLQTDGQLKTGRDVVIAALLGAEEFGFATAPLIAIGCIMMRKCHLNTCPVGIATQDPELRKKFIGKPEHVINFFFFVAEEVREIMASLGIRSFNELIGRTDLLVQNLPNHWKAKDVDLTAILHAVPVAGGDSRFCSQVQDHGLDQQLDHRLIEKVQAALERQKPVRIEMPVKNTDRAIGTLLSSRIAKRYGENGLPDGTIHCRLTGTSGQSFGAFLAKGVTLELEGDSNDYTGKGLSGGRLIIYPWKVAAYKAEENILIGNTVLYGATSGEAYFRGIAGERFAVRNSGALAVVEGVGDHGCEYMTGGRVIVLGRTGRNFAAGMSGGVAYVYDKREAFEAHCNLDMVELESVVDVAEQQWLREQIERHRDFTDSDHAERLLQNWDDTLAHFVRVIPTEYRAVLERLETKAA